MATIVFGALGAAAGASVGGGVLGLSSVLIGRAIGATLGRAIDQRLLGAGSEPVETGRIDRFRLTGASEGAGIARLHGRMRLAGQVIWASNFRETVHRSGGKGTASPRVSSYSYTVSLAIALCEGEISGVGRIWADGQEIAPDSLNLRVYPGSEDQLPDPLIEAVEGAGTVPAYRGTAYVVLEELDLSPFGNRVPAFNFEVFRPADRALPGVVPDPALAVRGVALIPGSGEYALATTPVNHDLGLGELRVANQSTASGRTDLVTSLDGLENELPAVGSVSLVVSWFGDDLRVGACRVQPRVEQAETEGTAMPWRVSGIDRASAGVVPQDDDGPVYGGTPADDSVIEAIREIAARGKEVMFYPFLLMEQMPGNGLPDPWSGAADQPVLPWRGRITTSVAPGRNGSPDGTAAAEAEVAAFFGTAQPGDFSVSGSTVGYAGPDEFSYRRFILHYAHLCAAAGGVSAFCIGSELRGITQIRGAGGSFPAVAALKVLAAEVRAILGPGTRIGYAADWSEYFGYHPQDGSGDVLFHLDPLWTDPAIDFVGIDNYMPLSDWRDGDDHADAGFGSIYNLAYLRGNVAGGEGYDWYYHAPEARAAQLRTPIRDTAHGQDWVFRPKDIRGWWSNPHNERIGGVRQETDTGWVPGMKPIWFTELGCPAVDKGSNQPNAFPDAKSSESGLPHFSNGRRDDVIQMQYLRAVHDFWNDPAENPVSPEYGGPMVDMAHAHVWAWDARPFPAFPNLSGLWSDAANYARGHWLNGRGGARSLATVAAECCRRAGVEDYDVSELYGLLRGYLADGTATARAALQPLMLAYGFDAVERGGKLIFRSRGRRPAGMVLPEGLVAREAGDLDLVRAPEAEVSGRLRLVHTEAEGDYAIRSAEAVFPDGETHRVDQTELALALVSVEGRGIAERWLAESRIARDVARFALPPSRLPLGAGDVVVLGQGAEAAEYRIDRVELTESQAIEATRCEPETYQPSDAVEEVARNRPFVPPVPVFPLFLDLPLLKGNEVPHAPHVAVTARPWPGAAAVWSSDSDDGYAQNLILPDPAAVGVTLGAVGSGPVGLYDRGNTVEVKLTQGTLSSVSELGLLNGANVAVLGDGSSDRWELFQFRTATLVAPRVWALSGLLRGQAGSDALMPEEWPEGSYFVLLDPAVRQIALEASARRLARHYRIGPALRGYDDPSYVHRVEAFDGIGLRPYAPVHLREQLVGGDRVYSWIRRTRINGDSWEFEDVPLGEATEAYRVRVMQGPVVIREAATSAPGWTYTAAAMAADGLSGPAEISVAQLSDVFGAGLPRVLGTSF
ncbi:baseplate multidomain protein megatron [Frigidibacter sp. ROC022]|uniref:baseplate multidomain protein megatron n=1 Tax=Frigidibacter sp. ROC022 TaxID=2971796 RepID=UPI00215B2B1E|nr:glycoside hydrolase/phage tail family protein [Frigidibacter sp. ROC022]MCR8723636.1 glycoside hydrolase/phage tail family protein [Frigidibacter sp. ROC022]